MIKGWKTIQLLTAFSFQTISKHCGRVTKEGGDTCSVSAVTICKECWGSIFTGSSAKSVKRHSWKFLFRSARWSKMSMSKILHRVPLWVEEACGLGSRISGTVAVEEADCQNELKPTWQQDLEGLGKTIQWNTSDISKYSLNHFFFFFLSS